MRYFLVKSFLFLLCVIVPREPIEGQTLQIDRLKANYLVNFADFVLWHGQAKTNGITIGVLNDPDLELELEKISNASKEDRPLRVVSLDGTESEALEHLDILFAGNGREKVWKSMRDHCEGLTILLVGEDRDFLKDGGAIQFTFRKNRLQFYVNQENANALGIQLSSKLIELTAGRPK
jgi:hypothetical protein